MEETRTEPVPEQGATSNAAATSDNAEPVPYLRAMSEECLKSSVNNLQEYETQLLGFTPKAFCDATHNLVLEYSTNFLKASVEKIQEEFPDAVSKERAEKVIESIFMKMQKALGTTFDRLENYLLTTIFSVPSNVVLPEDEVQETYKFTKEEDETLDKELKELKEKIYAEKYMEQVMKQELQETAKVQQAYMEFILQLEGLDKAGRMSGVSDIKEAIMFANATAGKLCGIMKEEQSAITNPNKGNDNEEALDEACKNIKL